MVDLTYYVLLALGLIVIAVLIAFDKHFGYFYSLLHKPEEDGNQHGGELVAQVLQAHGVKFVFTLVGGHISPILVAAEKLGIRVVDTRHEVTTVFAADAVARLSGTVGVAAVTAGPGLTNTVTAVKNAQMAESPVLLLGGAAATLLKGRGALQDIDQLALFKPLCKHTATVKKVRDVVPVLKRALQIAQSGTPGPVFVELPIDVLYPYSLVKRESGMKADPKGLKQKIVKWYIERYLKNLFAGAFEPQDMSPLPVNIAKASQQQVQRCAELLSKARKPLILIGSQATLPPMSPEHIRQAVTDLGVPCFLGGMARGLLGKSSPIQIRQQRRDALQEADLVLLAGTVCDFRLSYGRILNKRSKIISVNRSKEQMLKNADQFWSPDVAIQADVGSFLISLAAALKGHHCDESWIKKLRDRDEEKESINKKMALDPAEKHLNPIKVLHDLEDTLDDNAILVADGGDFVGSASYILRPRGPLRWLDPGAFGTLGVGAGFAMGAKLCHPEAQVVIVYGDGSAGYSIMEYDTFRRLKIPVMSVVGNDACWMQIAREQVPMFGSDVACALEFSDYHKVAESLGAKGYVVGAEDRERLRAVFQEAKESHLKGDSVLINALIGKTKFREGSLSV